jgi:hypothetical protein
LGERVAPVWQEGLVIPFNHGLQIEEIYTLSIQLSNYSGKYSEPILFKMGLTPDPLSN